MDKGVSVHRFFSRTSCPAERVQHNLLRQRRRSIALLARLVVKWLRQYAQQILEL